MSDPIWSTPADRARLELLNDPWRSNLIIADLADCHVDTVHRARRELEALGVIDEVGAWDRKRRPGSGRGDQYRPAGHQNHDDQRIELTPQPPSMRRGLCVVGGYPADWWHPGRGGDDHGGRAIAVCKRCPALADCAKWSMQLPVRDSAIYGGLTGSQRTAIQRSQGRLA